MEFAVVATFVLVPMTLGMVYLGKLGDSRHQMHEAARYAAWERTVWSESDPKLNSKPNKEVVNETLSRVLGEPQTPVNSKNDGKDIKPKVRKFESLLYVNNAKTGKRSVIYKEDKGEYLKLSLKEEAALKGKASKALGSLIKHGFSLNDNGLQTSTFTWNHEWIPALDVGLPELSVSSHNTLLTESWNAGSPQQVKDTLKKAVATSFLDKSIVKKGLSAMSKLGFKEFKNLHLGKIDVDRVPCQRLTNVSGKNPKC